jgi:hypothetical protein
MIYFSKGPWEPVLIRIRFGSYQQKKIKRKRKKARPADRLGPADDPRAQYGWPGGLQSAAERYESKMKIFGRSCQRKTLLQSEAEM